jgi:hypothetical protein
MSLAELMGLARALLRKEPEWAGSAIPLPFPSRVMIELDDGRREVEQVDLPVGSVASPEVERVLEAKVLGELTPPLGEARARAALAAGRRMEELELGELVAACVA